MAYDIAGDVRLDPRIKALLAAVPTMVAEDADSRETMVAEANTPAALQGAAEFRQVMELCDTEELAPSKGLHIHTEQIVSQPDGNTINLQVIRPETEDTVACVYYIHGGGMMTMSCYDGMYRAWGKVIAANGVAVVMVDFRNALTPSSAPEVAPFPAGLNDCVSGLHWVVAHASELNIDPARIVVAGESGGGNLTLATAISGWSKGCMHSVLISPADGPCPRTPRRRRTTGSCSTCITIGGPWPMGSSSSKPRTLWRGHRSPRLTTSPAFLRR
jgi:acetyl esterase/lipase